MSAYIVDRKHILYLVSAAMSRQLGNCDFSWWNESTGGRIYIRAGDYSTAAEAANMLWRENIASVSARYPNESSATLPGPIGENFVIGSRDLQAALWVDFDLAQVLKACDCYEYQSCEHPGWKTSDAKAFIDALRNKAWHSVPGYSNAAWGAPATYAEQRKAFNAKNIWIS